MNLVVLRPLLTRIGLACQRPLKNPYFRGALRLSLFAAIVSLAFLEVIPKPDLLGTEPFSPGYSDRQGELLRLSLASDDRYRLYIPLEQISPRMVEMTLLHEDRYFQLHSGFNFFALARATWFAVTGAGPHIGASTVTMQMVRLHYGLNTKTIPGKIAQILMAMHMEFHCSKHEILEAYLNLAPYGGNIEGVAAASRIYFGKSASDLTESEALTLAVIPQSPARRAPFHHKGDAPLLRARQILLVQWMELHPEDTRLPGVAAMAFTMRRPSQLPFRTPHLIDQLIQDTPVPLAETRLTIDGPTQTLVERVLHHYLEERAPQGLKNGCVLLIDYNTMEVRAAVGSANYRSKEIQGQVDGLTMQRSPGSALKPFIYALAMDQGLIHPNSLLKDEPADFNGYDPENFDRSFLGPISATRALVDSRNVPAVDLESRLNPQHNLYNVLHDVGVQRLQPPAHYGLTVALGSAEVSPIDMAQLYASLANRGKWRPLRYEMDSPLNDGQLLFSPESSFLTLDMLSQAHRPHAVDAGGMVETGGPVAWKTGTSFSFRDAWTAAVFDHYVLVVWVGNFDGKLNPFFVGRTAAAPLAFSIIDALRADSSTTPPSAKLQPYCFTKTADLNIRRVSLCAESGCLSTPNCTHITQGWFIPGVSPITPCEIHRRVWIDNKTGRRWPGYPIDVASAHTEVLEFWPSDFARLFAEAGLARNPLPQLVDSGTGPNRPGLTRHAPRILKPSGGVIYHLRLSANHDEIINLQASVETNSETVRWFVDAGCVGSSQGSTPLQWSPTPGTHVIRVVDDDGRSDSRTITVTTVK